MQQQVFLKDQTEQEIKSRPRRVTFRIQKKNISPQPESPKSRRYEDRDIFEDIRILVTLDKSIKDIYEEIEDQFSFLEEDLALKDKSFIDRTIKHENYAISDKTIIGEQKIDPQKPLQQVFQSYSVIDCLIIEICPQFIEFSVKTNMNGEVVDYKQEINSNFMNFFIKKKYAHHTFQTYFCSKVLYKDCYGNQRNIASDVQREDLRGYVEASVNDREVEPRRRMKNLSRMLMYGNMAIPLCNLKTNFYEKTEIQLEFVPVGSKFQILKILKPNIVACLDYLCPQWQKTQQKLEKVFDIMFSDQDFQQKLKEKFFQAIDQFSEYKNKPIVKKLFPELRTILKFKSFL